jgi:valyl-tRNA synthetase
VAPLAGTFKDDAEGNGDSIMVQPWPVVDEAKFDETATRDIEWLKGVIVAVRNIRAEMNIAPGKPLEVLLTKGADSDRQRLADNRRFLAKLAKLESITWLENPAEAPLSATQLVGELEVLVPMADLIDKDAELARLSKEIDKQEKLIGGIEKKLGNDGFVAKAPAAVVEKERAKLADFQTARRLLVEQREKIAAL